jgi:type IV pilus assembly protein PilC
LEICIDTIDNSVIAKDINFIRSQVIKGKNISEPLNRIEYFPDMVSQMITVGESTGNLDQMLLKVATVFDEEVDELIGGMTKMIEPMIIVFLGGAVAFVMIAMYLPIFMSAGGT